MNHWSHSPASRRSAAAFSSCVTISSLCSLTSSGDRAACQLKACRILHICYEIWPVYADMPLLFHFRSALTFRRDSRPCAHRVHILALPDPHQAILQPKYTRSWIEHVFVNRSLPFKSATALTASIFRSKMQQEQNPFRTCLSKLSYLQSLPILVSSNAGPSKSEAVPINCVTI